VLSVVLVGSLKVFAKCDVCHSGDFLSLSDTIIPQSRAVVKGFLKNFEKIFFKQRLDKMIVL
jgi:hypothetical protein